MRRAAREVGRILFFGTLVLLFPWGCAPAPGGGPAKQGERAAAVRIDAGDLSRQGWSDFFGNRFSEAERSFVQALEIDPRSDDATRGLVLCRLFLGEENEAIEAIHRMSGRSMGASHRNYFLPTVCAAFSSLFRENEDELIRYLERLADAEAIGVTERRRVQRDLLNLFAFYRNPKSIDRISRDLHSVRLWSFLGPFDNTAGSGHGKLAVTPDDPGAGRSFHGKWGIPFRWSTPEPRFAPIDGTPDLDDYLPLSTEATGYAVTTIDSRDGGPCLLSISYGGAISVFWNGTEIYSDDAYVRENEEVQIETSLLPGPNQLFVEASGLNQSVDFSVGVSSREGKKLDHLTVRPEILPAPEVPEELRRFTRLDVPFLTPARTAWEENRSDPENAFWYLVALHEFGVEDRIREGLAALGGEHDSCAAVQLLRSLLFEKVGEIENSREAWRSVRELTPDCIPAGVLEAKDLMRRSLYGAAETLLGDLEIRAPESAEIDLARLEVLDHRGWKSRVKAEAQRLAAVHPELSEPHLRLMTYYGDAGDLRERRACRDRWIACVPKRVGLAFRMAESLKEHDYPAALRDTKTLSELSPDVPNLHVQKYYLDLSLGNARGLSALTELLKSFPYSGLALLQLATIRNSLGQIGAARDLYRRLLEIHPFDFDVRNTLRGLDQKPPVEEILPPLGAEESVTLDATADSSNRQAPAVVLVDAERRIVFADGAGFKTRYVLALARTERGVSRLGRFTIHELPLTIEVSEAHTIKRNGERVDAQVTGNRIGFRSLAPGDLIELRYRVPSFQTGPLGGQFWDDHLFQWDVPCLHSSYELLVPERVSFDSETHNAGDAEIAHTIEEIGEFHHHTWEMRNVPGFWTEAFAPPVREDVPWLDVSSVGSWQEIADWYGDLGRWPSTPTASIRERADRLVAGAMTRREEAEALYAFVRDKIHYDAVVFGMGGIIPRKAADVVLSGFGDCKDQACLLVSLLRAREIPAHYMLAAGEEGRIPFLPSLRFTHAIAVAEIDGETFHLDPTLERGRCDPRFFPQEESWVLPVTGGAEFVYWESGRNHVRTDTVEIAGELRPDGKLEGTMRLVLFDEARENIWHGMAGEIDPRDFRELFAMTYAARTRGATIRDITWKWREGGDAGGVVRSSLVCGVTHSAGPGRETLRFPFFWVPGEDLARRTALQVRGRSLVVRDLATDLVERITLSLPAGVSVGDLPHDLSLSDVGLSYERQIRLEGRKLVCRRRFVLPSARITEEEYPRFRAIARRVLADSEEGILLRR